MTNISLYKSIKNKSDCSLLKKACLLFFIILSLTFSSFAQLRLSTLPKKDFNQSQSAQQHNARTQSIAPLKLPFWDDFSVFALDKSGKPSGYPDTLRWIKSNSVWVNNGMGINPPSINVATLDGLDSTYQAYEPSQIFVNGFTDKLISRPIDMTSVAADNRDSVYLRFFYQWQGNGEGPDKTDYFVVELKDSANKWVTAMTIYPKEKPDRNIFYDTILHVVDDAFHVFIHDDFQFRFRRYGRKSGPFDTWNIDYIYLNHFYERDFKSISDAALSSQLQSFLKPYWSVPYKHWLNDKKLDILEFRVTSLKPGPAPQTLNHTTYTTISNYLKSNLLSQFYSVFTDPLGDPPIPSNTSQYYSIKKLPDTTLFNVSSDSVVLNFKLALNSSDTDPKYYYPYYAPIDFRSNDTIYSTTTFYNYYAYDDGIAEYAVHLNNAGDASAYRFDMLVPKDTLIGFYVYFPDYGIISSQSTRFAVYTDVDGLPSSKPVVQPTVFINRRGLNNFYKVPFEHGIPVSRSFYIGWTESTAGTVKVGLDMNNDTGDRMFERVNGLWAQSRFIHGSIMIRPILGSDTRVVVGLHQEEKEGDLFVYPNPTDGSFFVNGIYDDMKIMNITGQLIKFTKEDFGHESKITLNTAPGLYLVQIRKGKNTIVKKIIIR